MNDQGWGNPGRYSAGSYGAGSPGAVPYGADTDRLAPDPATPGPGPGASGAGTDTSGLGAVTSGRRRGAALNAVDGLLAAVAGLMVVFVYDVHYMLTIPYWVDEAWVADSVRAPLGVVPRLASSTPLGWTLLLRLVPFGGLERQRLVPLAFAALAVAAGYLLGRELRLTRFAAGLLTAAAVLLSPAMLVRDDLKQYTAEAFSTILIWLLVARLENAWTRWRLAALGFTTTLATLLAETAIITGGTAFACLVLETLIRRQWRRLAELAVAGAGTLVIYGVIFELLVRPRINPELSVYWSPLYSPTSVTGAASFFWRVLDQRLGVYIGFPAAHPGTALLLAVPLIIAGLGVVALVLLRRYALAAMLPLTLVVVMAGSAARQYPFGDERTSTFWMVMIPVLMAIAVAAAIHGIGRLGTWSQPCRPPSRPRWALPVVAIAVGGLAVFGYVRAVWPDINSHTITHEDVRSQVAYAEAHFRTGDVIIADYGVSYGFAYYYKDPPTAYPPLPAKATDFIPQYPGNPRIIVLAGDSNGQIIAALHQALRALDAEPPAARGRIWIMRAHMYAHEAKQWQVLFTDNIRAGGTVTAYRLNRLGYSPAFQPVVLYALPPAGKHKPS